MKLKRPNRDIIKEILKKHRAPPDWQREKIDLAKRIIATEEKLITVNLEMRDRLLQILETVTELVRVTKEINRQKEATYVE